jgi:Ca-activated chloride channel homolog
MTGWRFQDPLWLLLLILLAALAWWAVRRARRAAVLYSDTSLLRQLPHTWALGVKRMLPWVRVLGMALVIAALARPQHGREEFRIRAEGVAIQMCIDRSGSMQAMDFDLDGRNVDRLTAVKAVFHDFVSGKGKLPGRPDDLLGLIAFGGFAEAKCPLTLDHEALLAVLDTVEIPKPIVDSQGRVLNERLWREDQQTAIGDTLALAVSRLKGIDAKSKVIILLSDGEQTAGVLSPEEGAKVAKTFGIKVYSIGVGRTGMAPMPAIDGFGRQVLRPVPVRLDEKTLKTLADATGGHYFHAANTSALEDVYAEIDQLEKTLTEGRVYTEYQEMYRYMMFPGLALIVLEILLTSTRFRSLP